MNWDAHDARTSQLTPKEEAALIRWLAQQRAARSQTKPATRVKAVAA